VDAVAARVVLQPETLDVVVASNLFGDILSDIGAAIQGGLGFAASANINPAGGVPSMFEPVHGSAPDIAGRGMANPLAAIWSGAMMLAHLGQPNAASSIMRSMEAITAEGLLRTPDQGGHSSTMDVALGVISELSR
jgi:tartrate dehydrogenase/decarboxylase/D-malate dehydrogenase